MISPRLLRRGDTSSEHPGLIFFRYNEGREKWVTPKRFEAERENKKRIQAKRRATPEYKAKMREYFRTYNRLPKQIAYRSEFYKQPHVREKVRATHKERSANDLQYKIALICRARVKSALRDRKFRKTNTTAELIGCSFDFFRGWIESQFQPGMSWENYGSKPGQWEVDHITPIAIFPLEIESERKRAFHYTNCVPMWAEKNRAKNDFIEHNGERVRARDLRKQNIVPFQVAA